ncbi:MAG: DUF1631 domain-containing protein [Usitatibacteraceae bacterium]
MHSFDNVIPFAASPAGQGGLRRRTVKPESVAVINDCRDIAVKRITAVLAKTFDTIEDELFDLAEKAQEREKQILYLDARIQAREKRAAIEASFRKQFLGFFESKVAGEEDAARTPSQDFSTLSLVEDDDLEEKLAMDDLAKRLSGKCDEELAALSQRMGFLLSIPEMKERANPMSPDTVVKALRAACDQMTSGFETKLAVMKLVEQHMANDMLSVYQDINAHLIGRQILPQIRPSFRRAPNNTARKAEQPAGPNTSAASETGAPPAADIFSMLQQLLAGGTLPEGASSQGASRAPMHGVATGSFAPGPLSALLGGVPEQGGGTGSTANPNASLGLLSALSQLQARAFAAGPAGNFDLRPNELRELKANGMASGSSQLDAITIDIVAMLFDYIFEDKGIPDAIKALLARLQIPVLKVAILDKSFFSRKNHPARHLMDVLAEASVSFAEGATHDDPLYKITLEIVDEIQTKFDTDIELFSQMLARFEQFMTEREAVNAALVEQSARVLHEHERRELARLIAQDETERRANAFDLPPPVLAILSGPWTRVLERVYLREGGRKDGFAAALETADNLIWSVTPKSDADQRKRLVSLLPSLLKQLQEGMQIAAVEKNDCDRFFSALVDCHAAAVRAGLRGESVSALLMAAHTTAEFAPLFQKLIAEEQALAAAMKKESVARSGLARIEFTDQGVQIEEIAPLKSEAARVAESPITASGIQPHGEGTSGSRAPTVELKRGTWVEFAGKSGKRIRAKLAWISPLKGLYLFTNPGAPGALSVSPESLHGQFLDGSARVMEESSLVDRAVENMVHSLGGASAA